MQFQPKTEEEIASEFVFPEGDYDFEVIASRDEISKAGNDMIALEIRCFNGDDQTNVRDWLLEKMAFKLRHFCATAGLMDEYESGILEAMHCLGRSGRVTLKVEKNPDYPDKNVVKDYVKPEDAANKELQQQSSGVPAQQTKAANEHAAASYGDGDMPF